VVGAFRDVRGVRGDHHLERGSTMSATLFDLNSPEFPGGSTVKESLTVALDEVPERSLLIATGRFFYVSTYNEAFHRSSGSFERCTIRPIPSKPGESERRFEVLAMGASRADRFMVTTAEYIESAELVWSEASE